MPLISEEQIARRFNIEGRGSRKLLSAAFSYLKFAEFNERYEALRHHDGLDFVHAVLDELDVEIAFNDDALNEVPAEGPFVVVCNHPHGIFDGLALIRILSAVRRDFRVVVNNLLEPVETLRDFFLPITWGAEHETMLRNGKALLQALRSGTPLVFFPAGSVAGFRPSRLRVEDREWDRTCLKFLARANVPVMPVHIHGRASLTYQVLYNANVRLSLAWLIREFFNQRNTTMNVRLGSMLFELPTDDVELGDLLRKRIDALAAEGMTDLR